MMDVILVRVSIAAMKYHDQKENGKKGVYLAYTSIFLFIIKGNQEKISSRAGNYLEAIKGYCFLAYSL